MELLQIINTPPKKVIETNSFPITDTEIILSISVLTFGIIVMLIQGFIIYKKQSNLEGSFKYFSVTLLVVSTLFLVTAGYDNQQIAPVVGLLGTISGYLLGKSSKE